MFQNLRIRNDVASSSSSSSTEGSEAETKESLASFGQASSGPRIRRRAITDAQRKDLRIHRQALMREHGKWTTDQMVQFFDKKYNRVLSQSTISESLSDTFEHLDEQDDLMNPEVKKGRLSRWLDLEAALFDWEQRMLMKKATVTDETLVSTAERFFSKLPQYHGVKPPVFSPHWLESYKARYKAKRYAHEDESDAGRQRAVEAELESLREKLCLYEWDDIYNMGEIALSWKISPDDTSTREDKASGKLEKARLTVILASNVSGTRKLPPWIIGKAQAPRCFGRSGVHVENFPMVWRSNGKAWMTGAIFEEYLRWFDRQMAGRKVCLLVDENFAHTFGIEWLLSLSPEGLANTILLFLPAGTTSRQPLDQGIVRSWKIHYRRRWLAYVCNEYDSGRDPMKSMNVLQAVRWVIAAWEADVTPTTIQNSWLKSLVLGPNHWSRYGPQTEGWESDVCEDTQMLNDTIVQMDQQIYSLVQQERIGSAMDIATFVNPDDEMVDDNDEDLCEALVEVYSTGGIQRDHETDEEDVLEAPVQDEEALELLSRLRLYEEQQNDGDERMISRLNEYERDIWARQH